MENRNNQGHFFVKLGHFFGFSKREGEATALFPSYGPVSLAEYASVSLDIAKYLKIPRPRFWIWYGCIYKGYAEFWISLIMAPCASIQRLYMPQYALMSPNMPENGLILLNILEYPLKYLNKLFWTCKVSQYVAMYL